MYPISQVIKLIWILRDLVGNTLLLFTYLEVHYKFIRLMHSKASNTFRGLPNIIHTDAILLTVMTLKDCP